MTKHISIKITGWVQGVGFRFCAYEKFAELELLGKAENTQDRGVLVEAEGPEEKLSLLAEWCHKGPMGAKVDRVDVTELTEPFVPLKMG